MSNIKLSQDELSHFRDWLDLNLNSITWEGRHLKDFNTFWDDLFFIGSNIQEQFNQFYEILDLVKEGPFVAWFKWLRDKYICYLFIYKNLNIETLGDLSQTNLSHISLLLRDFFIERYPHLVDQLNEAFQIGNALCTKKTLNFEELKMSFEVSQVSNGSFDDEVLASLEVTLYGEWSKVLQFLEQKHLPINNNFRNTAVKKNITKPIKFLQEVVVLFLIGGILIFVIKVGNKEYNEYLVKKISLFEPNFFWLDKNLSFKQDKDLVNDKIELSQTELEELEKLENKKVFEDADTFNRYEVESDVVLTSVDSLPKDFEVADLEQSNYEEVRKGGFRDMRYGRRKAYRVMLTSVSARNTREKIIKLLNAYNVKQVDNVKPGTEIPGGIYFNLHVPRKNLKEFLSQVSSTEESTILESKTHFSGPRNTNKVFIWIKSI